MDIEIANEALLRRMVSIVNVSDFKFLLIHKESLPCSLFILFFCGFLKSHIFLLYFLAADTPVSSPDVF